MPTDLDILMDTDPLQLTKADLDAIVAYHRNNRAQAEENKAKGKRGPSSKGKIDIMSLIQGMKADKVAPKAVEQTGSPRPGGLRRL